MRISAGNVLDSNCDGTNTKQEEANFKIGYKEMINPHVPESNRKHA